ncbi:MAG TPA: DUF1848 domain-containing protein [Aggregatilineaceae bacterium]|nr:DUF1848 domain-containing protein [Aggregatilineaceae bacterium]
MPQPSIISASRRTDIPAFYMPWFLNRLRAGLVRYPNPISGKPITISLQPEDVHSIVFWSKHYGNFLKHFDDLAALGYPFMCHYTITGLPRQIEPYVPDWTQEVEIFRQLAAHTSPRHVQWRFDPLIFAAGLDAAYYLNRFREIAAALAGFTTRCYFSFATLYGKVERRLQQAAIPYTDPPLDEKRALISSLAAVAADQGITLYACCQDHLIEGRVLKAHCIDGDLLAELFPERAQLFSAQPSRAECGCVASRDIGIYETCPYGCIYCYANQSHALAVKNRTAHNPLDEEIVTSQKLPLANPTDIQYNSST